MRHLAVLFGCSILLLLHAARLTTGQANNTCFGKGCSHACLLSDAGYTCACPYGFSLESDQLQCKEDSSAGSGGAPLEGSCIDAGYNDSCCEHGYCAGYPFTCFCDVECYDRGDCCDDITDVCPEGPPTLPMNVMVVNVSSSSAVITWIIPSVAYTFEQYRVNYGPSAGSLTMSSEVLDGDDLDAVNVTYEVTLTGLEPYSTYYIQVVSTNSESSSSTSLLSFTTSEDVPSGPPSNFTITVNKTSLICTWDPPEESAQNGEIVSYTLTCSSGGETVINLTLNPTVLEIDLNLFNYSTTYTCSLAASTLVGTGPTTVSSVTTEGLESTSSYVPFIPLGVEYGSSTVVLPGSDEGISDAISIPSNIGFPFDGLSHTELYIGTNGLISFGTSYDSYFNQPFPGSVSSYYLVAPFWDDTDTRGNSGTISYQIYESGYFLDHISAFLRQQRPSTFQGTWMVVAYWDAVHPYFYANNDEENTFQAIFITDGVYSYTVFTYKCDLLEWGNGATIGFNAPGGFYDNHDISYPDIDCINQPASVWSNVVYLLSNITPEFEVPRDVVISDISDNTATVSWTVPSITEPQEYYLIYGTSQDRLNLTSDRIRGHIDVSLVNETYSISLQNLESGTEYFVAVVALFGSTTLYSETVSFTTNEPAPAGPPRNFTITVDGISLMFSWQPPAGSRTILSYTVSCSVGRDVEFSARFNPVLGITLNELKPSTDYSCKVYASSSGGDGPPTDDILASTESANRNDVYLPFIPMDVSYGVAEMFLAEADEGTSDAISIPIGFPFGQSIQTQFYVGTNGLLSFGTAYNFFQNREFPFSARYLVAPFWDDMDTRGGNGRISYEIHQSGYFLDQVSTYLNRKRPSEFQGTWMAVAYYDAVHPYLGTSNPEENTFQAILITDGTYSYTVFTYKCGLMEWDNGATIGFDAASDTYANHDPSSSDVACLNMQYSNWSNVVYLLSNESPETPVPRDVIIIGITTDSAVISWIIPSFTRSEEYYIQYGSEETELDMTTTPIPSPRDTSLVNQTYSVSLQGLSPGTVYHFRVVAIYDVVFTRYSDQTSFRTYEEEQVAYLPFLNHSDTSINSGTLNPCNDCSSTEIIFPYDLPFGGAFHQSAYVETNGIISFGRSISSSVPELFPTSIPEVYWGYILAPFWADLNTTDAGSVSWEIHNIEQSPQLLGQVNMFLQTTKNANFNGTWVLIAFWEDITQYTSTFQAVLITDGTKSYSVYIYECGQLTWPGSATIGYNVPLMDYANDPYSGNGANSIACVHLVSPWNNIVYDLQPGSVILPTTPEPSEFIGSCVEAGFSECCEGNDCQGSPNDCYCDLDCLALGDCCHDFLEICSNATAPAAYDLLVAVGKSLVTVHYEGSDSSILHTNYSENTLAVDFDYVNSKVYWSHTELEYSVPATIYSANLDGSDKQVLVSTNLLIVSDIAVDWIAGHLYWVDSSWARIEALELGNLNRTEILQTGPNTNPSAIAIDPITRNMFWSDLGETAQIERASMDGSERRVIISSDISRPVGITIDYSEQRIYWSDVDLYRIEYCNYDGTNRFLVETEASGLLYPYALTVANDLLFWTDWVTDSVYATHKEHGSDTTNGYFQLIATFSSDPYGIEALLGTRQMPGENPCENSTCSHICLLSTIDIRGYTCVCPEGFTLEPDDYSCKAVNDSEPSPPTEGACIAAGYTSCCTHGYCAGYPPTCFCHPDCTTGSLGCCSDLTETCPSVPPLEPFDLIAFIYSTSARVFWTVERANFGLEAYSAVYGLSPDNLNMESEIVLGVDPSSENVTYTVILDNLQPLTVYYYSVRAENLAGVTYSSVEIFATHAITSSVMATSASTAISQNVATTASAQQPPQSTAFTRQITSAIAPSTSTSFSSNIARLSSEAEVISSSAIPSTSRSQSSTEILTTSTLSTRVAQSSTQSGTSVQVSSHSSTTRGAASTSTLTPTSRVTQIPSSSESVPASSSSLTASSQGPSASAARESQTPSGTSALQPSQQTIATTTRASASSEPSMTAVPPVASTTSIEGSTMSSTVQEVQTTQPTASAESTRPKPTPIETKTPPAFEENSVKVTLADYDEKNFDSSVKLTFKIATAEAVSVFCSKNDDCKTVKLKREILKVESDDVGILQIVYSSSGVSLLTYVLVDAVTVLDGDTLLLAIQDGSDIYMKYNFNSVTAEKMTAPNEDSELGNLSTGALAGIVICAVIVTIAVVTTAGFIFYRIRKKGLYKVSRLVGDYDGPMTDRFVDFGSNIHDENDEVKKDPAEEKL